MNVALRRPMSLDEFLAWDREQELRYEFDGIQPIAMTGGTIDHSVIGTNVVFALESRLREPCRAFRSDLKILVEERVRYPDVVVTCSLLDGGSDVIPEPVVVFEVLSASTAPVDRGPKAAEYQATPSVQHYVMLEQTPGRGARIIARGRRLDRDARRRPRRLCPPDGRKCGAAHGGTVSAHPPRKLIL